MKIASWNTEGRLTLITKKHRGTPEQILNMIERIDADVLVLPEAYIGQPASGVDERLRKMGYTWRDVRYDEHDSERIDDNYVRVLSRFKIFESQTLRWNDARGLISVLIEEPSTKQVVRFIATHLDERSEKRRLAQLKDAVDFINSVTMPTVMLGDFNAMHLDKKSRFIRAWFVRKMVSLIPHIQIRKRAEMLMEMAKGSSLTFLESKTNLYDIDSRHQATVTPKQRDAEWMPSIRIAQIDHIFVTPDIVATNFEVSKDGGSDHRAILAEISLQS